MIRRLVDLAAAAVALVLLAPVLAAAALGIRLASPGSALYPARRIGRGGRPFTMYKLRTMHAEPAGQASRVTAVDDPRVFPLGRLLRRTKIDELPQLVNVLRGEMAIVGPRPEDPDFVREHYAPVHWETLTVRPGLSSPGSLYHETHCWHFLAGGDPESAYLDKVLPLKLALDLVYVRQASFRYDLVIVARTLGVIAGRLLGRRWFADPPELPEARGLLVPLRRADASRRAPIPERSERSHAGGPASPAGLLRFDIGRAAQ